MIILLSLLGLSFAKDPDPWGRPSHPRVVTAPPKEWSDLFEAETRYSFFWDEKELLATIQMQGTLRWRTIAQDVHSGWVSKDLPKNARFRIRLQDADRTSPLLKADPWYTPADLARLGKPKEASLSRTIGEITGNGEDIYAASLTGGLVHISSTGVKNWTRFDGLPSDRVLAVATEGDRVLVGTAEGMALIENNQVSTIWDEGLSDLYVQSVGISHDKYLAGTYRGLDRVQGSTIKNLLPRWSIFSILPQEDGAMWVGYEGITRWSVLDEYSTQEWPGNVYAIELTPTQLYLATQNKGVAAVTQEGTEIISDREVTGLAHDGEQLWMAAGAEGLLNRQGEKMEEVKSSVWSLESQGEELWLGTSYGIQHFIPKTKTLQRYPIAPWATEKELNDLLPRDNGAFLAHKAGITPIGKPHPAAQRFASAIGEEIIELIEKNGFIYAIGKKNLYTLLEDGNVRKTELRGSSTSATWFLSRVWISTTEGVFSYQVSQDQLEFVYDITDIIALSSSPNSLWGISSKGTLLDIKPTQYSVFDQISLPLSLAPSGLALCVGTEDGVYRVWKGRKKQVEDILNDQDKNVAMYAVAADENQGCWVAGEDGSIGRLDAKGSTAWLRLTDPELPSIKRIIPQGDQAWVLTASGTWLISLEK